MKLAIVVQRYGQAINGGAELHARYVAERLARHAEVEVWTTCATDYVTWRDELPSGEERVNNILVRRFPVKHERDPLAFGRLSERVFNQPHSIAEELDWLDAEGPTSTALTNHIRRHASQFDFCIFFSYRYYHAFHGARAAGAKAILVPTAERDAAAGLSIFRPIFRGVRALMYNSPEERTMIQAIGGNHDVPSVVVGIGSEVPPNPLPQRFRQKHGIRGPFAIYIGRIDENKGCRELFEHFNAYLREKAGRLTLVLIGNSILDIPSHPRIRHLGFLDDTDKFDALAAAELLIMPSFFESLSMVALEAWALGKPVLANAKCDVLKGQCIRSNAGLYYESEAEFVETLRAIEFNKWIAASLGRNGRQYYRDHYDWPVIERKYLDMLERLSNAGAAPPFEPMPGWMERRRATCPPAAQVVAEAPSGPSVTPEMSVPRPSGPVSPPLPRRPQPSQPASPPPTPDRRRPQPQQQRSGAAAARRPQGRGRRPSGHGPGASR
ncbi:MAG TPA: glycosyltransferase family 4 protein [Vicinamibacterales bacterium]|nr:glycosyltransferase family 4 protein [Vicinamibacterales bacterium]